MARQATLANATMGGTLKLPGLTENVAVFCCCCHTRPKRRSYRMADAVALFSVKSSQQVDNLSKFFLSMEKERRKEGRKRERKDGKKERPLVDLECGPAQPSLFSLANWDVCFLIAVSQNTPRTRVGPGSVTEH